MKVLVTGLHLESNTFSSHHTEYQDFHVYDDLSHIPESAQTFAKEAGIELVAGFFARAMPGGVLSLDVYNAFQGRIFEAVRANKDFDAILLKIHGASVIDDYTSAEERLIKSLRHYIGPMRPMAATFDLHGNVRQECFAGLQYATALRTAPHTDNADTCIRALTALQYIHTQKVESSIVCKRLPLVLPGEAFMTTAEPASSLYKLLAEDSLETTGISSSIFCGFAWADMIHTGVSVVSCSTKGMAAAADKANSLADAIWATRSECVLQSPLISLEQAFTIVEESYETVFMSDTGDNLTAGTSGNRTDVLYHALKNEISGGLFAQFWDKDLVELARKSGVGTEIPLQRLQVHDHLATVIAVYECFNMRFAILDCAGNHLIVSEWRFPCVRNEHFEALNLDLASYKFCVFKLGYLFPELAARNFRSVLVDTPGASGLDVTKLSFSRIRGNWYPKDPKCPQQEVYV